MAEAEAEAEASTEASEVITPEVIPAEWGWPKEPFLPEDLRLHVLQETQGMEHPEVFQKKAPDETGKGIFQGIDANCYNGGKWYRYLNYKGDCYLYVHNYTKDITASRPSNFTDLTEEEKARIAKLGVYIKFLPDELRRIYDNDKAIPIVFGTADTCDALRTFVVYDKDHQLLDATTLAKRITSSALEECRKAIVAACSLGKMLWIYCGDAFPDFAEKVCVSKNRDTFPMAVFHYGAMESEVARNKVYREEDKEAGQCPLRPGFRVCILVQYDGAGFQMSSMRLHEDLPQKIPNFGSLPVVKCYSDADEAKVLELMRSGEEFA